MCLGMHGIQLFCQVWYPEPEPLKLPKCFYPLQFNHFLLEDEDMETALGESQNQEDTLLRRFFEGTIYAMKQTK